MDAGGGGGGGTVSLVLHDSLGNAASQQHVSFIVLSHYSHHALQSVTERGDVMQSCFVAFSSAHRPSHTHSSDGPFMQYSIIHLKAEQETAVRDGTQL